MTWILRILWFFAGQHLRSRAMKQMKSQGVVAYLRILQGSRRLLFVALLTFFILQLIMIAGIGAVVSGVFLLDLEYQTKIQILFGVCLFLFLIPLTAIAILFSESVWYRASGAKKMVDDLVEVSGSQSDDSKAA